MSDLKRSIRDIRTVYINLLTPKEIISNALNGVSQYQQYLQDNNREQTIRNTMISAFRGMVDQLDQYSYFMPNRSGSIASLQYGNGLSVDYEILENNIAHIEISQFTVSTDNELESILGALNKREQPPAGYILDLRGNRGGISQSAINIADHFLDKGTILHRRYRDLDEFKHAKTGDLAYGKPIVVLIDKESQSASELLVSALKDNERAIIVGENSTFGKGFGQMINPINSERCYETLAGYMVLTNHETLTPNGREMHGVGIDPDVKVLKGDSTGSEPRDVSTCSDTVLSCGIQSVVNRMKP